MNLTSAHLDFLARLYELPTARDRWPERLNEFAALLNGKAAAVLMQDPLRDRMALQLFSTHYDVRMMEEYNSRYVHYEQHGYDAIVRGRQRGFVSDRDACGLSSDEAYATHPPAAWFRDRYQVGYRYASNLNTKGAWIDLLAVNYGVDRGPMTASEKEVGELFLAHFAKVVELQRTFMLLEHRHRAALEALDRLDIGVLITTQNGSLVLANAVGEQILTERDTVERASDGKVAGGAGLASSIADVAATAAARGQTAEKVLHIVRRSGRAPYLATISPLRDGKSGLGADFLGAIVFLIDPENPRSISTRGMEVLFELTEAEAKVLELVVAGHSTEETAKIRSVSPNTIRSQIQSILGKTRLGHRADLVRLAAAVNPPVL